jgi:hypothetical protein
VTTENAGGNPAGDTSGSPAARAAGNLAAGIVRLDARAVRASVRVVALVGAADLGRPTPCGDWTLGELLAHMTAQHDGLGQVTSGVRTGVTAGVTVAHAY